MEIRKELYIKPNENMVQKEDNPNSIILTQKRSVLSSSKLFSTQEKSVLSSKKNISSFNQINNENCKLILEKDKHYYNKIENMNNYIEENYPNFGENFELLNFISYGGTGIVYEGRLTKGKNNQRLAFKFKKNQKKKVMILKRFQF